MDLLQKRIDQAWNKCKQWITEFDGAATETYLSGVSMDSLAQGFAQLAQQSANFRATAFAGDEEGRPSPIAPEAISAQAALLIKDEIAGIDVNYTARLEGLDLDLHMIVNPADEKRVDLEIVWWADQAFDLDDATANPRRFQVIMAYFIQLQSLFNAAKLFVGPENPDEPGISTALSAAWVEI